MSKLVFRTLGAPAIAALAAAVAVQPVSAQVAPAAPAPVPSLTSASFGDDPFSRFFAYQIAELGKTGSPVVDPDAPAARRADWPPQPVDSPPMPFTEWPYGGATSLGVNRPDSVDSPLMFAIAPTGLGKLLDEAHIQTYGWLDVGANVSTSSRGQGNSPAAYDFDPNTIQLDQAVLYIERTPDTVQKDHVDWGFRLSGIYGTDYRFTTSYGLFSYQLLKYNRAYGFDTPMVYAEVFVPQVMQGLLVRAGRFVAVPDVEAQLAPNNYMYSHSLAYTFDNFTNTGVLATLAATKNLFLQFGVTVGTDTAAWNVGVHVPNPDPNPLYPGSTFLKDPGARPSYTGCLRYETDNARDDIYICANGINTGVWGYNNLQWTGFTYYHKFNDQWHVAFETYNLHEKRVPNLNNPVAEAALSDGGTPFSTPTFRYNAPGAAFCNDAATLTCTATAQAVLAYTNWRFGPLDNLSIRTEYYDDMQGQRTGTQTEYVDLAVGVQHWLSPQIELRPEVAVYGSLERAAFNGDAARDIAPDRDYEVVVSGDAIVHF